MSKRSESKGRGYCVGIDAGNVVVGGRDRMVGRQQSSTCVCGWGMREPKNCSTCEGKIGGEC